MPKLHNVLYPKHLFSREKALSNFIQASHYHRPFGEIKMNYFYNFMCIDQCDTQQYVYYRIECHDGSIHIYRRHWHENKFYNLLSRILTKCALKGNYKEI
jgi:hypothetical protein